MSCDDKLRVLIRFAGLDPLIDERVSRAVDVAVDVVIL